MYKCIVCGEPAAVQGPDSNYYCIDHWRAIQSPVPHKPPPTAFEQWVPDRRHRA